MHLRLESAANYITSDELNCLIYSYLVDAGFQHASYCFREEAGLSKSKHRSTQIPRGQIITLMAKALAYTEVQHHWKKDSKSPPCIAPFSLLETHVCRDGPMPIRRPTPPAPTISTPSIVTSNHENNSEQAQTEKRKASPREDPRAEKRPRTEEPEAPEAEVKMSTSTAATPELGGIPTQVNGRRKPYNEPPTNACTMLMGHTLPVFVCAWNPASVSVIATGSKDATVRLWSLDGQGGTTGPSHTLKHIPPAPQRDITSLDWNPDGTLLATGAYDGILRVWTPDGETYSVLNEHTGPIFAVKWSKDGQSLLSGSVDATAVVWDVTDRSGPKQIFRCHSESCLDVEWIDDKTFVSCAMDKKIHLCQLGWRTALATFSGHANEVNQIRFCPERMLLASCSDDETARIWNLKDWKEKWTPTSDHIQFCPTFKVEDSLVLRGHTAEVGTIAWCPMIEGQSILSTASFDSTARLWNANTGECLRIISKHTHRVYTSAFSPDGQYFATGGGDGRLFVHRTLDGELAWEYEADGSVFEVAWSKDGAQLAVCLEEKAVAVLNLARLPRAIPWPEGQESAPA